MRTLTVITRRIALGTASLCLTALPATAQLYSYHSVLYTEGNLFFYGEADDDEFAHAVATGDFNGDGADDLATGIPYDDNAGGLYPDSGIVIVRYGVPGVGLKGGLATTVLTQANGGSPDPPGNNDYFGWSLAVGNFNGDGYDDLAVGIVEEATTGQAGAVQVYYGSAAGINLAGAQFFTQETPGISGESEDLDFFGFALAAGNFDADAFDDLAIGVNWESSDLDFRNGRVVALYGSSAGLSAARSQSFDQDTSGMDGSCEDQDIFGSTLAVGDFNADGADDLAVGVAGENGGGGIQIILGSLLGLTVTGNNLWTQDDPGVPDSNEPGDHFSVGLAAADFNGDGYDDLAVGARQEDLDLGGGGTAVNAGAVSLFYGSSAGISGANSSLWTESSAGLDPSETGDEWGYALTAGDFDHDGYADLAVGAPWEALGGSQTGQITILRGDPGGVTSSGGQLWHQDSPGVPDSNEQGDKFGLVLAAGDFDGNGHADLVIGAPRESTTHYGNGAEWVLYGFVFADGLETGNTGQWQLTQNSTVRGSNGVSASTAAKLGTAASQYGLRVSLNEGAGNATYVMAGPARGFRNETALKGSFFINPQNLTVNPATGANSFQFMTFLEGFGSNSLVRLIFELTRNTPDGDWFINVSHWNDNVGNWQFSGGGFFALDGDPSFANNRIDFEWTRGNPGHLTMWRTRYLSGAPDSTGTVQMLSVNLPGMQNARLNYVFAGMFSGQDPGTFGALYLDELSFSR